MGLQALNLTAREWFTPPGQDDDNPTRFEVQGLSGSQQAMLAPELGEVGDRDFILPGRAVNMLLRFGLVNWENFNDDKGPIDFIPGDATANQDRIPYSLQAQLAAHIFRISQMSADVKKKS